MDNDDRQIGRLLNRREFLALMATLGAGYLAACTRIEDGIAPTGTSLPMGTPAQVAASPSSAGTAESPSTLVPATQSEQVAVVPSCVVRPELAEGPFFVDTELNRSDIRIEPDDGSIKAGVPLTLTFNISQVAENMCVPLAGAVVDVWHCDALGVYSGVQNLGGGADARGATFLRGYQETDENGNASFTTIYPGWYTGRAVHIHFKVRTGAGEQGVYDFTSQLFFDEALSDQVYAMEPYAERGLGYPRNAQDGIFNNGGDQLLLDVAPEGDGYAANFSLGLDLG